VQAALAADLKSTYPEAIFAKLPRLHETVAAVQGLAPNTTVSFAEAHQLKTLLDDAIRYEADPAAKKAIEQVTQRTRAALRDVLRVHEPYNSATAGYEAVMNVRGGASSLIRAIEQHPDTVANLVKAGQPDAAQGMRRMLLEQGGAEGRKAWDAMSQSVLDREVYEGPAEALGARLKAFREGSDALFKAVVDTPAKRAEYARLTKLGNAMTEAAARFEGETARRAGERTATNAALQGQTAAELRAARRAGTEGVRAAADAGRESIAAVQGRQQALRDSSLHVAPLVSDIITAGTAGATRTPWATGRAVWHAVTGPTRRDLLTWASRSDARTQDLVRALLAPSTDRRAAAATRALYAAFTQQRQDR
jgi:hypothetical protein